MLSSSQKENDFLKQTLSNAGIGVWHVLLPERRFFINKTFAQITGFAANKIDFNSNENWIEINPKDGLQWLEQLTVDISKQQSSFSEHLEIQHKEGHLINIQINGKVSAYDLSGNPTQITGTLFDYSNIGSVITSYSIHYTKLYDVP